MLLTHPYLIRHDQVLFFSVSARSHVEFPLPTGVISCELIWMYKFVQVIELADPIGPKRTMFWIQ